MARLNGTLTAVLVRPLLSNDGQRRYEAGETVTLAIDADANVAVLQGDRPPVIARFAELVGSDLPEALNG